MEASPIDMEPVPKRNISDWGVNVVKEMNRIGMMIDISHVSYGVMSAVLDVSEAPVIFSHSSAYSVNAHHRNVQDDILDRLAKNKGIIMVNFYPDFIGGETIETLIGNKL